MATKMIAAWSADLYTWVERDTARVIAKCLAVNAGLKPRARTQTTQSSLQAAALAL